MSEEVTVVEKVYKEMAQKAHERWMRFLSFQSVSTDVQYQGECIRCAEWLIQELTSLGFRTELIPSSTKPVVYGEYFAGADAPVVLYYGHYDVQPPDPLNEWHTKPFEPTEKSGRVYARGAQDNKGQTSFFLAAVEALIAAKKLHCTLRVIIEGEEESGSKGLNEVLPNIRKKIAASVLMVSDSEMYKKGIAAITMGFRGVIHLNVHLQGAKFDLHSGNHGGVAPNPAQHLVALLSTLHDEDGRVAVKGYYEGIPEVDSELKQLIATRAFDEKEYYTSIGIAPCGGEKGYDPLVREGLRPTLEINGIHSGYGGPGLKTIIPACAEAKLTGRMVRGQDPHRALDAVVAHLKEHVPHGCTLSFEEVGVSGPALSLDPHSTLVKRATRVLISALGASPVFSWSGGSIPVLTRVIEYSGAEPLLVGFGLPEDRIHSPNESFSYQQFHDGFIYSYLMLEELGKKG